MLSRLGRGAVGACAMTPRGRAALDRAILAAHAQGDAAALAELYARGAGLMPDRRAAAFLLTQAHVFALEAGHPAEPHLRARLQALGAQG